MPFLPAATGLVGALLSVVAVQTVIPGTGPSLTIPLALAGSAAFTVGGLLIRERMRVQREALAAGVKEGADRQWQTGIDEFRAFTESEHEKTRAEGRRNSDSLRADFKEHIADDRRQFDAITATMGTYMAAFQDTSRTFQETMGGIADLKAAVMRLDKDSELLAVLRKDAAAEVETKRAVAAQGIASRTEFASETVNDRLDKLEGKRKRRGPR